MKNMLTRTDKFSGCLFFQLILVKQRLYFSYHKKNNGDKSSINVVSIFYIDVCIS